MPEFVPAWAKGIVWYQIFPERFSNGDRSNDPTLADIEGAWPHAAGAPFRIHPWTSDWYAREPYEQANGLDMWQTLSRRRYGGDLQGIIDRLDYLQDLGVGGLYLNPVFESPSEHKYDGATYHHIDPNFGPDPTGDRALMAREDPVDPATWVWTSADKLALQLIDELHRRGMRIIFDGVWNHMGLNSWAYRDVVRRQQASPYAGWFKIRSWDDPDAGTQFEHVGWAGAIELPELQQDQDGIVDGPRQYIFAATERWLAPNGDVAAGIDGWRLDVAFCIAHPFWQDWRRHVRSIDPEAYLVAEVVQPVPVNQRYLLGDEFDAVMNYNFAWAAAEWLWQARARIDTATFDAQLHRLVEAYPPGVAHVMQNHFSTHDTARLASHIVNRDHFNMGDWENHHAQAKARHAGVSVRPPSADERALQRLFVLLQMTYVGAPMIYYGDEAGMWGANDPCCRQPMTWPELRFTPAVVLPDGTARKAPAPVGFDADLHAFYRQMIRLHNSSPALRLGDFRTVLILGDVYGFGRRYGAEDVIVLLNRGAARTVRIAADAPLLDRLTGDMFDPVDGTVEIEVPGVWGRVLAAAPRD